MAFNCQNCALDCCWNCRKPLQVDEIKTIANRFCEAEECVIAEAKIRGVTPEWVRRRHQQRREPREHTA